MIAKFFGFFAKLFKFHKMKMLFFVGSVFVCLFFLFPYSDLSDLASSQVAKATRNQVNLQFEDLGFGFMPQFGMEMDKVSLDLSLGALKLPNLKMESFGIAPNIFFSIWSGLFGGITPSNAAGTIKKIQALGLFDGNLYAYIKASQTLGASKKALLLDLNLEDVKLQELTRYLKSAGKSPFVAKGVAQFTSDLTFDTVFKEQPNGSYDLNIKKFSIPATTYKVPFGGVAVDMAAPGLAFKNVNFKGVMEDRQFVIKKGILGDIKDELFAEITGNVILNVKPGGKLDPGGYNFVINMTMKQSLIDKLGSYADILGGFIGEKFKRATNDGVRYNFRIKGRNFKSNPNFTNP